MMNTDSTTDERVYTMDEVLQEEEDLIVDANAMLGEADPDQCSYNLGYIRQVFDIVSSWNKKSFRRYILA